MKVTRGGTTYEEDESNEIVIKDGTDENDTTLKDAERRCGDPCGGPCRHPCHAGAGSDRARGRCRGEPA
ncbi:MAG: hypothetical protein ACLUGP_12845 [Faecalibacterium prausnitzii]